MKKSFVFFVLALAAKACAAQTVYTVIVDSHRCLVLEPDHLPQNAPFVLLLRGAHGSATNLMTLWSELHLPPSRVVFPDGFFFSTGRGLAGIARSIKTISSKAATIS